MSGGQFITAGQAPTASWSGGAPRPAGPQQLATVTSSTAVWQAGGDQQVVVPALVRQQSTQYVAGGRVVVPPQWQQAGAQPGHVMPATGLVATTSMQMIHNQVNHIKQQFPQLTHSECQQLLLVLPKHLREMQNRDNAGRSEYLLTLSPKERQVVTFFHMRRHHSLMQRQQAAMQQQHQQQQQQQPQLQQQPGATGPPKHGLQQSPGWQAGQPQVVATGGVPVSPLNQQFSVRAPLYNANGQPTQHLQVSPGGVSPHHQDSSLVAHSTIAGGLAGQGLHHNLVNQKTKTALANLLSTRLSSGNPQQMELPPHILQKVGADGATSKLLSLGSVSCLKNVLHFPWS